MKQKLLRLVAGLLVCGSFSLAGRAAETTDWTAGMKEGKPEFKSMGSLAFGPDGVLFVADAKSAAITAIATGDKASDKAPGTLKLEGIDKTIASLLGTKAESILIEDLATNPLSSNVYLSVSRGRGPDASPVLVRVVAGSAAVEVVSLDKVKFARADLPDAPTDGVVAGGNGKSQSNPRTESITDIAFFQDRVIVAGLSNEEFASTLRAIPFPFQKVADGTSVEIYHGAHGKFETRAPVRTLVPINIGNQPSVLAAYTCTPLVKFPVKALEPKAKIKGTTIAELGNRNRPLDMVVYQKDGKEYLLIANNSRGVMKIPTAGMEEAEAIVAPVGGGGTKGVKIDPIAALTGVEQLDKYGKDQAVVLRRAEKTGPATLETLPLP